jgi:hypothetical protein
MSGSSQTIMAGVSVLFVCIFCAGCLSTAVGDTWYENQSVRLNISHSGEPADVHVQVTVYRISSMTQERFTVLNTPVSLSPGENSVAVPGELPQGSYKLYVYILSNGDRKAAVIRDIVV